MAGIYQHPEVLLCSEAGIDLKIIHRIIFMPTVRCKNRRHINTVNSKLIQVWQIIAYPTKGAPMA